jgi:hypothetical protein
VIFRIVLVAFMMAGGTVGFFLWEYQVEIFKTCVTFPCCCEGSDYGGNNHGAVPDILFD